MTKPASTALAANSPLFVVTQDVTETKGSGFVIRVTSQPAATAVPPAQVSPATVLQGVPGNRISVQVHRFTAENCEPVGSVEEAEDRVIALAEVTQTYTPQPQPCNYYPALTIMVNRGANLIASRTRRGAGNVVLANPKAISIFHNSLGFDPVGSPRCELDATTLGRWKLEGLINSCMKLYSSDAMPEDKIVVAYVATGTDGPGQLLQNENGLHLHLLNPQPNTLGETKDFVQAIGIKVERACGPLADTPA